MKKLILVLAMLSFASSAFATTAQTTAPDGVQGFKNSKNVGIAYASWTSGVISGSSAFDLYSIASKHQQGDKIFGTTSASPYIGVKPGSSGTPIGTGDVPSQPASPSDTAIGGYSLM